MVGYKRPPTHSRFKAGQSGNPKGRARGTVNLKTDLEQELAERIPIREGDRNLRVSKQRALLKAMLAKALKGDTRAASIVLQLVAKTVEAEKESKEGSEAVSDDEMTIVEEFIARRMTCRADTPADEDMQQLAIDGGGDDA